MIWCAVMDEGRRVAFLVLRDVEAKGAYVNLSLRAQLSGVAVAHAPFVRELVYGTVRWKRRLDGILAQFTRAPLEKTQLPVLVLLRMGLYQLLYMDSVPDHAAISQSVELAKRFARGREGFVNGVLRSAQRMLREGGQQSAPAGHASLPASAASLAEAYSFEDWIVEMWLEELGGPGRVERLLAALNERPRLFLRANTLLTDAVYLRDEFVKRGFEAEVVGDSRGRMQFAPTSLVVSGEGVLATELYAEGLFTVQDLGAQRVAGALGALPWETVVDVCAAPGGKTAVLAQDMKNVGRIVATDIHANRVRLIEGEMKRLGITIVEARARDAREPWPALAGQADRVLVDAPCSGLGTARRKPEVKYKPPQPDLPKLQLEILTAASAFVKEGGVLLYATCTLVKRENEGVAQGFLDGNSLFEKVGEETLFPDEAGTDGFYYCLMKKNSG